MWWVLVSSSAALAVSLVLYLNSKAVYAYILAKVPIFVAE